MNIQILFFYIAFIIICISSIVQFEKLKYNFSWQLKSDTAKYLSSMNFPFPVQYIKMPVWPAPAYFHALKEESE